MKWVLMAENYDSRKFFNDACDPAEVVYRLAKINENGEIKELDGFVTGCQHGWIDRMKEAISNGVYEKHEVYPKKEPKYKAVKC